MGLLKYVLPSLLLLHPATVHAHWPERIDGQPYTWIGMVSPVVVDLDGDGPKELVVTAQGNPAGHLSTLYILDAYGDIRSRTDADYYFGPRTFPSIADIDDDGSPEIVMPSNNGGLLIYNSQGVLERAIAVDFQVSDDLFGATVLADLDHDGPLEIAYGGWYLDGSRLVVLDRDGNDLSGFPVILEPSGSSEVNTPAVGNLDDDADWEIVAISHRNGAAADTSNIRAYDIDGSRLWSQRVFAISHCDPVIGDVNADGFNEVVFASEQGVYVLDRNGNSLLERPLGVGMEYSNIALADLDGDDDLEIIFAYGPAVYAMHHDGTPVFAYPTGGILNPPMVGDIDGDGSPDILFSSNSAVYAVNAAGVILPGFPRRTQLNAYSSPSIDDIDVDGIVDVMASANWIEPSVAVGIIYVWECGPYDPLSMQWPMFQHDLQHTGYYQNPVTADVPGSLAAGATMPLSIAPNPSRVSIRMTYGLRKATNVTIEVFSVSGALVRRLEEGLRAAGPHALEWDGRDEMGRAVASGVYLARIAAGGERRTGRVVITR